MSSRSPPLAVPDASRRKRFALAPSGTWICEDPILAPRCRFASRREAAAKTHLQYATETDCVRNCRLPSDVLFTIAPFAVSEEDKEPSPVAWSQVSQSARMQSRRMMHAAEDAETREVLKEMGALRLAPHVRAEDFLEALRRWLPVMKRMVRKKPACAELGTIMEALWTNTLTRVAAAAVDNGGAGVAVLQGALDDLWSPVYALFRENGVWPPLTPLSLVQILNTARAGLPHNRLESLRDRLVTWATEQAAKLPATEFFPFAAAHSYACGGASGQWPPQEEFAGLENEGGVLPDFPSALEVFREAVRQGRVRAGDLDEAHTMLTLYGGALNNAGLPPAKRAEALAELLLSVHGLTLQQTSRWFSYLFGTGGDRPLEIIQQVRDHVRPRGTSGGPRQWRAEELLRGLADELAPVLLVSFVSFPREKDSPPDEGFESGVVAAIAEHLGGLTAELDGSWSPARRRWRLFGDESLRASIARMSVWDWERLFADIGYPSLRLRGSLGWGGVLLVSY